MGVCKRGVFLGLGLFWMFFGGVCVYYYLRNKAGAQLDCSKDLEKESRFLEQERLKSLGELSAGFTHQINNPLNGVSVSSGLGELIAEACLENLDNKSYEDITSDIKKMNSEFKKIGNFVSQVDKIIKSVTTLTKTRKFKDENLKDLVHKGIGLIPIKRFKDINLVIDIPDDLPLIRAKAIDIEQVIMNILTNAIDAIGKGDGEIKIEAKVNPKKEKFVELNITDTGKGMSEEVVEKIFDSFYTTKGENGMGLGLYLVYKMIKAHQGEIYVNSIQNRGTAFTIYLSYIANF